MLDAHAVPVYADSMELTAAKIGGMESVEHCVPDVLLEDHALVRGIFARQSAELAALKHAMREGVVVQEAGDAH